MISEAPEPGQVVRVRQRQYLVEETVPPPKPRDATLVRLSCMDDDAQGVPLEVLWEREVDPEILSGEQWDRIASRGFDAPNLFSAYLHTLRWNSVTATDPRLFQAPFRAGIRLDAYQLEPLRKALLLPRVNLFIADDVGLGKTIEAGLILRELLLRKKVRDVVVACPPSMLAQWKDEMEARFGLGFEVLDRAYVARVRRERGYAVNPWTTHSRFLISHRLLIDETYTAPLRDWLGELRPGAMLILDEAHHAAPSSGARYAIDSKITRAVRDLAGRFEHRLFLSATPHNGHSNSFSALLEILDPQRFCRGVPVRGKKILADVMVRRLKDDVRELCGGFPKRNVVQIDIDGLPADAPELKLAQMLDEYRQVREERLAGLTKRQKASAGLLISGLQQRLLSSIEAFSRTLRVHCRTVARQRAAEKEEKTAERKTSSARLDLVAGSVGSDDDRAELSEEELRAEEDAQIEAATAAAEAAAAGKTTDERLFAREQALREKMAGLADASRCLPDARVRHLVGWIRANMCPDLPSLGTIEEPDKLALWNDTRVIIFTEYDDTKRYLREQLAAAIRFTERAAERIAIYHGPTPPQKREEIKRAFNAHPSKNRLRILIATDAAREGLNLQSHCSNLFHFDLPWNPSRMEQRNGRVDRKLQPAPEVSCHYFFYHQRPEDRVLQVLVRKTETIKKELGSLAQVLESRMGARLSASGIRRDRIDSQVREIEDADLEQDKRETMQAELEEARERQDELRAQVDRLRNRLEVSKEWIGLDEEHFRAALSSALALSGAEPLDKTGDEAGDSGVPCFTFPALDQREGADPTWAETMDALRPPRRRDQKFWEWRRDSPVRPVVFEDTGTMDDDVVHLHLEHRVVRRLLSRFTAQGFVHHDLSRACLAQTKDAIPRVILIGRLALYGNGAARLHEEVLSVTARWTDPKDRKGALKPYAREAESKTLGLLEDALLPRGGGRVPARVTERLQRAAPHDVRALLEPLEERGRALAAEAENLLARRGEREATEMRRLLEAQRKRIGETCDRYESPQLSFDFDPLEKRQLESNRNHWKKRLAAIERELDSEPRRIRDAYDVRATRIEPVGLVYLWPVTG